MIIINNQIFLEEIKIEKIRPIFDAEKYFENQNF